MPAAILPGDGGRERYAAWAGGGSAEGRAEEIRVAVHQNNTHYNKRG